MPEPRKLSAAEQHKILRDLGLIPSEEEVWRTGVLRALERIADALEVNNAVTHWPIGTPEAIYAGATSLRRIADHLEQENS